MIEFLVLVVVYALAGLIAAALLLLALIGVLGVVFVLAAFISPLAAIVAAVDERLRFSRR